MEDTGIGKLTEMYVSATCLLGSSRESLKGKLDAQESSLINQNISQIQSLCLEMDHLLQSLSPSDANRDLWITRVESVAEEANSLKERFESVRVSETEDTTTTLDGDLARDLQLKRQFLYMFDKLVAIELSYYYKMVAFEERLEDNYGLNPPNDKWEI